MPTVLCLKGFEATIYHLGWPMAEATPLPAHPQFTILEYEESGIREYRVKCWRPQKIGTVPGVLSAYVDTCILLCILAIDDYLHRRPLWGKLLCVTAILWLKSRSVLWESVLAIPGFGLQLERQRGFPPSPIFPALKTSCSRIFIPLASIMDIVVNEALWRWNVRYYLAVIHKSTAQDGGVEDVRIAVAFEDILPLGSILKETYHGLRETLFDEFEEPSEDDG